MTTRTDKNAASTQEVDDLYEVADTYESDILDNLRRRAGHTWDCYGEDDGETKCWTNLSQDDRCDRCGTPRPPH